MKAEALDTSDKDSVSVEDAVISKLQKKQAHKKSGYHPKRSRRTSHRTGHATAAKAKSPIASGGGAPTAATGGIEREDLGHAHAQARATAAKAKSPKASGGGAPTAVTGASAPKNLRGGATRQGSKRKKRPKGQKHGQL